MDRNTLIGFLLIGLIFIGYIYFNQPSEEQKKAAQEARRIEQSLQEAEKKQQDFIENNILTENVESDSVGLQLERESKFGAFASASEGEEIFEEIESDLLKIKFSNKGGKISKVELKNYKTHDSLPLILFDGEAENNYGFTLITANNRVLNTSDLFFEFQPVQKDEEIQIVTLRLNAGEKSHLDFVYTIQNDNYMLNFDIVPVEMQEALSPTSRDLEMFWTGKVRQQEKGRDFEERYSGLFYKYLTDNVESLSESKSEKKRIPNRLKWVACKDQFFSSILIADDHFAQSDVESVVMKPSTPYLKELFIKMDVPFDVKGEKTAFKFYFGPNHYKTLRQYDKGLHGDDKLEIEKLVPLGWTLFRWVNQILTIPMFNFFGKFISSYGIIILLMTIVIKLLLFPLTYKSYMSSARMRVLKPEIEKINEKIPASKPQERQKATMDLYRRAGVNPMGGCLPMLLQMPILIALFSFFPSSIELRQQSFLWANDLSTYDAVINLPFNIPFYGSHVSLFCLLMTVVNIIYTKINMATQDMGNQQMPGMKTMMYLMPLMFLFFFNNYASGLSYYYLVSLLITIIQTFAIRASVDEEKLLKQLTENKKKPVKKSGFMARLEEAQKKQAQMQKAQTSQSKKKK